MGENADRRPLASRQSALAQRFAAWLGRTSVTPNQISFASMVAGLASMLFCVATLHLQGFWQAMLLLFAALACQLRLICNLMDGMVAIESGKRTANGAFWNEAPDRVADIFILVGIGIAAQSSVLGWTAAALAVLVAYVRELGKGIDGTVDFTGPMAKQHRMAVITLALLLGAVASAFMPESPVPVTTDTAADTSLAQPESLTSARQILLLSLWICILGCLVTFVRRCRNLLNRLN